MIFMNKNIQQKLRVDQLRKFVNLNPDARQYFYSKADERWLSWLWENGFFDVIKQKAEDPTRYGYKLPELNYLAKVVEKEPIMVVDIILAVPISVENFNPEVVDRFLRICSGLPALELKRMVNKIRDERWTQLMGAFNEWGFEYEKMLQTLISANDFDSILILAEAILSVRTKKEIGQTSREFFSDNPFYFNDIGYTKVFEYLLRVDDKNIEKAIALVTSTMIQIMLLVGEESKDEVFKVYDKLLLFDVDDFFTLEFGERDGFLHRDDVKKLAAVIKNYAERTFGKECSDVKFTNNLYDKYFKHLPDSRSMWRLRLFVLSLCPGVFKEELKKAFFRLFEVERYYNELISGTEYLKALRIGFSVLSDDDKRKYVKQVIGYFVKKDQEKENEKENWHIGYGSRILSVIADQLTEEEKQVAAKAKFTIHPDYEPEPSIKIGGFAGSIRPRGPITQEAFGKLPIDDIAKKIRTEWRPEKLREKNTSEDFHNPLNAEGAGELLRVDISKRLQDYVNNANLFFERDILDQHYTYSFLRGVQEVLRGNKTEVSDINWDNLIALCVTIKKSGETKHFDGEKRERDTFDAWLSGWTGVHSAMTDVVQELLTEERGVKINFPKYRDGFFEIISYLLAYLDPIPADEEPKTATITTSSPGAKEQMVSDPYSMAINTVRGRAFQAFALFMYQDGKKISKDEKIKISSDVKGLYEAVLKKENTRALMFMFGHYLPAFYFRDKEWTRGLLPQIFPTEPEKKHLYTAAWEGYLSNNLYEEMFFSTEIQKLYERGLILTDADYPKQKHFKEPDKGIATHLALAFMYYKDFGFGHVLFDAFWKKTDSEQHADFVSFLGRMFVYGSNSSADELLKKEPRSKQRLRDLWDWMLKNYKNAKPFVEFGSWISLEKDIFDPIWLAEYTKKTLEKTKGSLDWDYGLMKSIIQLAKKAPKDTLEIARFYLLEGGVRGTNRRFALHIDNEWLETLNILYGTQSTRSGISSLINNLIREGGSAFWGLESVLSKGKKN